MSEKKIIIAVLAVTVLIIGGAVLALSGSQAKKAALEKTVGAKIQISEESFDFKDIPYSGGNVEHGFMVKNIGDKKLEIANLATSCACSKVFLRAKNGDGPKAGMKGMSAPTDWKGSLEPGEEGQVVAVFDPAYHGPQGVGPISRIVSFETNDPDRPYVELSFSGRVVK